jgi:hypothetical protein
MRSRSGLRQARKPKDYLDQLQAAFVHANINTMPALMVVTHAAARPHASAAPRAAPALDAAGFSEATLRTPRGAT